MPNPSLRPTWDPFRAEAIIADHAQMPGALLPILHALQEEFGHVPEPAVPLLADALNLSRAEVHGVITFYHDFRHDPAGRHVVKLCRAEACQSMKGEHTASHLLRRLGIDWGGTTPDGSVTVEPVYCLGLCATAPAALVDGEPHGRLTPESLAGIVEEARRA
ncbi:formate dehydrogenase subunit gamma [Niveispirillum irakense]|uniref:formate dehydrogenase subunit gamma n=1 Tax=Niveispirillum irakense TaxID=34011 RepID=UPI000404A13B|nr:formate dehydrogenase subunit gamma [Niveispirillum irakense]